MKAVWFEANGGPEVLQHGDLPEPLLAPDEALVRVRACGINHLDLWVRKGLPGLSPQMPHVLGNDIAGEIVAVGDAVRHVAVGARTLVLPTLSCGACPQCMDGDDNLCRQYDVLGRGRNGGYAEFVSVPAVNCLPYPERLSFEQAASVPLVFLTAWHMLVGRAALRAGEDVLIMGAGSGVGTAAIQIARMLGARVLATATTEAKRERARTLGASEVFDSAAADLAQQVRAHTDKKGADVVIEHVGGRMFEAGVAALARNGRLVTCGATIGAKVPLDLNVLFGKHLSLMGSWMGRRAELVEVMKHVTSGALEPVVDRVLPLAEARRAHEALEGGQVFGKIVLVP
ncbi:MAG: zinc-binding dehydrogenase [Candidatus Eisenbacteria bacterium]